MQDFLQAYVECAAWSSMDDEGKPLDQTDAVFAPETLATFQADCQKFLEENDVSENGESQAGHDFWLTRNGHGCGFWDGDWPITGDTLSAASKAYGEVCLYIGDDGLIYCS